MLMTAEVTAAADDEADDDADGRRIVLSLKDAESFQWRQGRLRRAPRRDGWIYGSSAEASVLSLFFLGERLGDD